MQNMLLRVYSMSIMLNSYSQLPINQERLNRIAAELGKNLVTQITLLQQINTFILTTRMQYYARIRAYGLFSTDHFIYVR